MLRPLNLQPPVDLPLFTAKSRTAASIIPYPSPSLPSVLRNPFKVVDGPPSSAAGNQDEIAKLFPCLFGQPSTSMVPEDSSDNLLGHGLKIGVVLCRCQAPEGHNVISVN